MKDEDYDLPDLKGGYTGEILPESTNWSVVRGAAVSEVLRDKSGDPILCQYNQVKHLGYYGHMSLKEAASRVILEWLKVLEMNCTAYEDDDLPKDLLRLQKIQVSVSIPYSEVPKEISGEVII